MMKKLARYLIVDVLDSLATLWRSILVFIVVFFLLQLAFDLRLATQGIHCTPTLGDRLVALTVGCPAYLFDSSRPFIFPIEWAVPLFLNAYLLLWYPFRSLYGHGAQVVVYGGSRWLWWTSKCIWACCVTLLFWSIGYFEAFIATIISDGKLVVQISPCLTDSFDFSGVLRQGAVCEIVIYLASIPVLMSAIGLIQLAVSLAVHPIIGYSLTTSIIFLSAYGHPSFLIGGYAMASRSSCFISGGMGTAIGLITSTAVMALVIVAGGKYFSTMDLLKRGREL